MTTDSWLNPAEATLKLVPMWLLHSSREKGVGHQHCFPVAC